MLEIKNTEVFGLERSMVASGNPMVVGTINTNDKLTLDDPKHEYRSKKLGATKVGSAHDHYLLGIHVQFDIKYPQYWTIEAQRYHNFEIISSQSKMHRLTMMGKDENFYSMFNKYTAGACIGIVKEIIDLYNSYRIEDFSSKEDYDNERYDTFMRIISSLPMGFEMWMTCDLTYLQLKTIYLQRKNHKLKEDWGNFCKWCEELPMFCELIGINKEP